MRPVVLAEAHILTSALTFAEQSEYTFIEAHAKSQDMLLPQQSPSQPAPPSNLPITPFPLITQTPTYDAQANLLSLRVQDLFYFVAGAEGTAPRQHAHEIWVGDVGPLAYDILQPDSSMAGTTLTAILVHLPPLLDMSAAARRARQARDAAGTRDAHGTPEEEHHRRLPLDHSVSPPMRMHGFSNSPPVRSPAPPDMSAIGADAEPTSTSLPLVLVRSFDGMIYPTDRSVILDAPKMNNAAPAPPGSHGAEEGAAGWWKLRVA